MADNGEENGVSFESSCEGFCWWFFRAISSRVSCNAYLAMLLSGYHVYNTRKMFAVWYWTALIYFRYQPLILCGDQ